MKKTKSLFKITSIALASLHAINKYIDVSVNNTNKKSSGKYYHWKHGDIYYKKTGSGSPIVLIHDLNVFSSNYEWSEVVEQFSKKYTVYAIDLIGCGKSDKPEITYTNYFYVQMLTDFISDVIGEKTAVAATGLSGSFVLMANSMNENLISDIVLINPKSLGSLKKVPDDRSKILLKLFSLPVVGKTAYYIAVNKPNIEYFLTEKCFYNPFNVKGSAIKAFYKAAHNESGKGKMLLASLEGNYVSIDITKVLSKTNNKLTIVFGEHYDQVEDICSSYTRMNPSIQTVKISGTKALPHLESPEAFIKNTNL